MGKISQNLSSAAVVIGALRIKKKKKLCACPNIFVFVTQNFLLAACAF